MPANLKRRLLRAGGWNIAKRLIKPIPIVGSVLAVGLAAHEVKKKGLVRGAIHVGLDATPVVGTIKNVVEIFTGDFIADKKPRIEHAPYTPPPVRYISPSSDQPVNSSENLRS